MSNEMTTVENNIAVFGNAQYGRQYSSFSPDTMEGKIALYNAINAPENRISESINQEIMLKDAVVMAVNLANDRNENAEGTPWEENQRERIGYRSILIDEDGVAYTATSTGIYNSLQTMHGIFGTLHFEEPLKVVVKQIQVKNGKTLSLAICK